jgi:hypothetical protein
MVMVGEKVADAGVVGAVSFPEKRVTASMASVALPRHKATAAFARKIISLCEPQQQLMSNERSPARVGKGTGRQHDRTT